MFEPIRQTRAQPRRQWPLMLGLVGAAFAALIVLMGLGANYEARQSADAQQAKIALAEMRATADQLSTWGATPVIDTRVKATGVAGQAEGVVKQYAAQIVSDKRAYQADLKALGFPSMLQPRNLAHESLGAAHANLVQARAVVEKYRALNEKRVGDYRSAFAAIDLSPEQRAAFQASFDAGQTQNQSLRAQAWGYEGALLGEFDGMVLLLDHARGQWLFDGRMLRFRNPALLAAYNGHIFAARQLVANERALLSQTRQTVDSKFDDLISATN